MHLTRCTSLDVLHADLLHSVYYALHSVYYAPVYYALDTLHFNRCINAAYLILCVLDPMYFSEGLRTEKPFAMPSGKIIYIYIYVYIYIHTYTHTHIYIYMYGMVWYGMVWYGMVWYGMVCMYVSLYIYICYT